MPLSAGTRLGSYEIVALLGVGGMGEVYRARDTRLGRDVALKVLPDLFANDADRLARFEREAKTLAALNHPGIAQIHGLEEAGGARALVMELVGGEDLSRWIARGAIPFSEALPIARQIAEALEYAHEHGVVHRDLKPANIKVTPDGAVKILDFGLAKAIEGAGRADGAGGEDLANSPTITSPATRAGIILGTAAYMSPEQAKGRVVDKRTDIWAFGCVVFELLTGRRAFAGDDVTDLIVAVMTKEPEWARLPPMTSPRIVELLKRCLRKDARERLRDIGDARIAIEDTIARGPLDAGGSESAARPARVAGTSRREKFAWALSAAALTALGAAGLALSGVWPRESNTSPLRVSIVHTEGSDVSAPAISPDGTRVAYAARRTDGMPVLWVRDLASGEARALAGTEDASVPFWSPDSRDLGFGAGGALKRVPADGGPVQVVTGKKAGFGGAWAADGTIVFSDETVPMFRVSAAGGAATPVTKLQGADWSHYWPSFLPDGRRFLFTAKLWTRDQEASEQGIYLGSLDNTEIRRLLPDLSSAVYTPLGALVFVRDGTLTAAPFDLLSGRVSGPPAPIGGPVAVDDIYYLSGVSTAVDGTLAVRPPPAVGLIGGSWSVAFNAELRLIDRAGAADRVGFADMLAGYMALHPDGRRLAAATIDRRTRTVDLSIVDLQSGARTPLTTTRRWVNSPIWSPDGTQLAYAYVLPGQMDDVYIRNMRTGEVTPVIDSAADEIPLAWSHDGASLLVLKFEETGEPGLWVWSFGSRTLTRFVAEAAFDAAFSPDDRYVAFGSLDSGRTQVLVTTFPERSQTWPLTTEGGRVLSWRADGGEILVATHSGHVVAYPVSTKGGFSAGQPTILVRDVGMAARFSTARRDHSKILIRVSPDAAKDKGEIRLLFGWADAWRQGRPLK